MYEFSENKGKDKAIPKQALWVPEGLGSQISRQSAHDGGSLEALPTGHLYSPGNIPSNISVTG